MSDTTTITPEERQDWRERLESPISCHDAPHRTFTLRSLTALEQAESRAEKSEAEVARLTKERDWLAKALADDGCPYMALWSYFGSDRPDWCICIDTADDGFDCNGDPKECWKKEAARKAVASKEK